MADYKELEKRLYKYTDGWQRDDGEFPLENRAERTNADAILKKHYEDVSKNHLDYENSSVNGVDYKVEFAESIEKDINEELDPNKDPATKATKDWDKRKPKKLKKGEMIITPNKMPTPNMPINQGIGCGVASSDAGGLGESLNEEYASIPNQAASIIADFFRNDCGAFGGERPKVRGNTITFFSQYPNEQYIIKPDLSVIFNFSNANVQQFCEDAECSASEAIQFFESECKWRSIRDWLEDDANFGWAGNLTSKEREDILKEIDDLEEGDFIDVQRTDGLQKIKQRYDREIQILNDIGFEFIDDVRCMAYTYDDGDQIFISFPGSNYKGSTLPWRLIQDKNHQIRFKTFDLLYKYLTEDENIEDESLNEDIEKHDELNQKLFDGDKLKPEVRNKLLEIVDKFKSNLEQDDVEIDINDIAIVGSNVSYNYTKDSDIDLHIAADLSDFDDYEDLAMKLYQAYKSLFNDKYDPTIFGHEVELYVEPDEIQAKSNGMYSILSDEWIKEPVKSDIPDVDQDEINNLLQSFIDRFNMCTTVEDVDELIDDIYILRQEGILQDGEYSVSNLVFKEFRNRGYLNKLKDMKVKLENDEMSLH